MGINFIAAGESGKGATQCLCRSFGQATPSISTGAGWTAEFVATSCAAMRLLDPSFISATCQDVSYVSGACLAIDGSPCALVWVSIFFFFFSEADILISVFVDPVRLQLVVLIKKLLYVMLRILQTPSLGKPFESLRIKLNDKSWYFAFWTCSVQNYSLSNNVCQPSTFARFSSTQFYCGGVSLSFSLRIYTRKLRSDGTTFPSYRRLLITESNLSYFVIKNAVDQIKLMVYGLELNGFLPLMYAIVSQKHASHQL